MTFKVGSGKANERLAELNRYRRPSQGEVLWSLYQDWDFATVEAARTAEDHLLGRAKEMGWGSEDHSEFIVGIGMSELAELFSEAVDLGATQDEANA
ncbi:hypothetical protein GCM10007385_19980 [Tateyamaria omphalii]|nr:hypothetical protein GCM10007385_19980 [Tateyamaria omphalii]